MPGKDSETGAAYKVVITREFHLVNGLKANTLISTNIIVPKQCIIDLAKLSITISTC
jgi:hypothetical protein